MTSCNHSRTGGRSGADTQHRQAVKTTRSDKTHVAVLSPDFLKTRANKSLPCEACDVELYFLHDQIKLLLTTI